GDLPNSIHTSPRIGESCNCRRSPDGPSRMNSTSELGISIAIIHTPEQPRAVGESIVADVGANPQYASLRCRTCVSADMNDSYVFPHPLGRTNAPTAAMRRVSPACAAFAGSCRGLSIRWQTALVIATSLVSRFMNE